jgi:hypothetical protein
MSKLFVSLVLVLLSAAYFFGADASAEFATLRNSGLLLFSLVSGFLALRPTLQVSSEAPISAGDTDIVAKPIAASSVPVAVGENEVLGFLGLMQQKGRLLDFLMDDVSKYPDAQVGAAARVVHQGCSAVLRDYFEIKPVAQNAEGSSLTLNKDYDAHSYRLLGRVIGEPPFTGRLLHRGWLTTSVKLPEQRTPASAVSGAPERVIAPAEVELS